MAHTNKQKIKINKENINNNKKVIGSEKNRLKGLKKVEKKCLMKELNKEYETMRLKKVDKKTRNESINRMYNKCKNQFVSLCTKRSSSKIIQCMIKYAEDDIVQAIYNEVKEKAKEIICKPFGGHVFEKLYKFDSCKKIVKENAKYLITDRIGVDFLNNIYKKDKNIIEGIWNVEKSLTSEKIGMISIKETSEKIIKKEMYKHEIAHDIIMLGAIGYKYKSEDKNSSTNNYQINIEGIKENVNLLALLSSENAIDTKIYEQEIEYTDDEISLFTSCINHFPDLLTTRSGTILALNSIKNNENVHSKIFEQIMPYFLKIASNKYGVHFLIHYYNVFDKECIHKQVDILFYDMFINEYSVLLLVELAKNKQYKFTEDKINHVIENFTDYIRNHNWLLVCELAKINQLILNKSTIIVQNYKENNILNDLVALNYFLQLDNAKTIDLQSILGVDYKKYNKNK